MKSFLDYLKEHGWQIEEDAVLAANSSASTGSEVTAPSNANVQRAADVVSHSAAIPMTDNSVLGKPSKKGCKDCGFFGKDDFHIPQNMLSGEVERRIDK